MGRMVEFFQTINVEYLIKYGEVIAVMLAFLLIGPILSKIIIIAIHKIEKNKKKATESGLYEPLKTFFYVLGIYISIYLIGTTVGIQKVADKIFRVITIVLFGKGIADSLSEDSFIFKGIGKNKSKAENEALNIFLSKIFKIVIYVLIFFIVVKELTDYDFSGLIAGLGIGSAALALAAQDLVKSLIGGITIITDKPFIIGDFIEVGVYTGTVEEITLRSTRIRAVDNSVISFPNSLITAEYIINWSRLDSRIIKTELRIDLEASTEQINRAISKITTVLKSNEDVKEDTVQVHLSEIRSDCNCISILAYVKVTDYNSFLALKDRIYCDILEVLERENIDLVYPTQLVYTKKRA